MQQFKQAEDAGQIPKELAGTQTGVFIGISAHDYSVLTWGNGIDNNPYASPSTNHSIAANRLSYFFNFQGPSLALNTACSSSLVAIHYALRDIEANRIDYAIAGGINMLLDERFTNNMSRSGFLSKDNRCKVFDNSADGSQFVFSEPVDWGRPDR